ncbi:S1 RNA-binding domain-containing protein [Streptomyces sp. M2CJ-2]|uniref:S1 RNA-binding domain-containing protein n=1 Tax=Streptomyces sp. M2CJ-2 TaxID=2803948 RepID=UPI00192570F9|nr:S1 RNA-binding domain-containing protein [Streptomyces sp. M2CJ-2]MBL3668565.1 S1 RNA-binding domain-containing protein [Streptomyces sp. M2CJ-2]
MQKVGQVVAGVVTKLVPFGAFVRVEDREDGLEGLVHNTDLSEKPITGPEDVTRVGAPLIVKILDVDPTRRRITLSPLQALAHGEA